MAGRPQPAPRIRGRLAPPRAAVLVPAAGLVLAAAALLVSSCAQIEPPSGGPEDTTPPRVLGTFPDSGAVGVPLVDTLSIVFSESMNRSTVEESFFISPPVDYQSRKWEGRRWLLRLREPLRPNRTYVGLLGIGVKDAHGISPRNPWSFAFATAESLDTGQITGQVIGQRFSPKGAFVYVWPWEEGPPDTTSEGYPRDPLRLGQADVQGKYTLPYLPRGRSLRICALYDRGDDMQFDPAVDRWGCYGEPVEIPDTVGIVHGIDLYLSDPDEPGTVAGSVVDSLCLRSKSKARLAEVRAARDSLGLWLELQAMGGPPPDEGEETPPAPSVPGAGNRVERFLSRPTMTAEDSLRVGAEMLSLDSLAAVASAESAWCARTVLVHLHAPDSTVVRESRGTDFRWSDVSPGAYALSAFRDVNGDGKREPGEPSAVYPESLRVRPLHVIDSLRVVLPSPESVP